MSNVIKAGVALAALVAILSIAVASTGLHKTDPNRAQLAFIIPAMLLNVGAIVWALRKSATKQGYAKQLGHGILIGVVASLLIFVFSYLMLTRLLPEYLGEFKQGMLAPLQTAELTSAARASRIAAIEAATPVSQAFEGVAGTMATSLLTALIAAIFLRRQSPPGGSSR